MKVLNDIIAFLRSVLTPPPALSIAEWCEQHFYVDMTSRLQGKWRRETAPWMLKILDDFKDPKVSFQALRGANQVTGKTLAFQMCATWMIRNRPGPTMWVGSNRSDLLTFAKTRMRDSWDKTAPIAEMLPRNKTDNSILDIKFPTMPFVFAWAGSEEKLTSKPIQNLFCDEAKGYPPGHLAIVRKRTSFYEGISKTCLFSTGNEEGSDWDLAYNEGDDEHWHIDCPHCGHSQEVVWGSIEFDTDLKNEHGEYDWVKLYRTIRVKCSNPACGKIMAGEHPEHIVDQDEIDMLMQLDRERLLKSGRWIAYKPNAPADKKSYTCPVMINPIFPLRILVNEYLLAKEAAKLGNYRPLQDFYCQRLGLNWNPSSDDDNKKRVNVEDYDPKDLKEGHKIITVDVQTLGVFYGLCWNWQPGKARFVAARKMHSWDEVKKFQDDMQVKPHLVFVDYAYDKESVWSECVKHGWRSLRGMSRPEGFQWAIKDKSTGQVKYIPRSVSQEFQGDPAMGKRAQGRAGKVRCHNYDDGGIKDILARIIRERIYTEPEAVPAEYTQQMRSERKAKDKQGKWIWQKIGSRDNHYWDCACMQVCVAVLAKLLKVDQVAQEPTPQAETAKETAQPASVPVAA